MTASLPMYDTPVTYGANNRFWSLIRDRLGKGPSTPDRKTDSHDMWLDPDLVLSQTCGLPYRTRLHGRVTLVGAGDYGLRDCPAGFYRSVVVVRSDDPRESLAGFRTATFARNDRRSQSGWAAIETHLAENRFNFSFLDNICETGSHLASVRAVVSGHADIASIDAVTWALICRDDPVCEKLRVIAETRPTPGLPFITAAGRSSDQVFAALQDSVKSLDPDDKECLMLRDVVRLPAAAWLAEPLPPPERDGNAA